MNLCFLLIILFFLLPCFMGCRPVPPQQAHYEDDAWKKSAVVRDAGERTYSGYVGGGEYRWVESGKYQWYDASGNATDYYTSYSDGEWSVSSAVKSKQ